MAEGPYTATKISQHTLWTALTGEIPPMVLPATPIAHATLDSRVVEPGDLFVAFVGQHTDGHNYIDGALRQGAQALIVEERGIQAARAGGAAPVDCTRGRWALHANLPDQYVPGQAIAYVVDECTAALQSVGAFQRMHRTSPQLKVIGVTGSIGKTSTKELIANVLRQRYVTLASQGNLNNEQGLPLTLLQLGPEHERAVLEMGMYDVGEIARLCILARPQVGIVTNVGPSHLGRLGTMERIAEAKSELIQALPAAEDGGVAVLNWDDERVRAMADRTKAHVFRFGLTSSADLWADDIQSAGMEGIRFRFHYRRQGQGRVESCSVRGPLLGRHSVHTALGAAAVGVVDGLEWDEIVAGMQDIPGQLRLVVVSGINGSTLIDDTYNASPASTVAALNLLADVEPKQEGRRVAVLGDMLELGSYTTEGHRLVGRRAADVVDLLVTVGKLGAAIAAEALSVNFDTQHIHVMEGPDDTIALLRRIVRPGDVVLVKGSRAVGMETIATGITADSVDHGRFGNPGFG